MNSKRVSVMVVEDSPVVRELITSVLNADPRLRVDCAVESAERALRILPRLSPDVISMDIRLPGMDGIEATRLIMEQCPTPIVVVAADFRSETVNRSMEALRAGALAVMEKPTVESVDAYGAMARRLCDQFVNMSQVKVVRQRFNGMVARHRAGVLPRPKPSETGPAPLLGGRERAFDLIGIVASTGGPAAIARLLQGLGAAVLPPILIVQHMAANFLPGYADWLNSVCSPDVRLAHDLEEPVPGCIYVAPGHGHLTVRAGQIRLIADKSGNGHVPSGDMLFTSLAESAGARGLGVLLTGMGADGARGLLAMRNAGAHTIVQDEVTSAVYGMPAAACALGAAVEQFSIAAMADRIAFLAADTAKRNGRVYP
jgi:two-component system chemotaxis response regulator CheB